MKSTTLLFSLMVILSITLNGCGLGSSSTPISPMPTLSFTLALPTSTPTPLVGETIDIQTAQEFVTLIKDIVTGLSALAAVIIAGLGLHTWKKQLKGKTEYELAQRLLRAVYEVREALAGVRNPFQSSAEIYQAMKEADIEGDPTRDAQVRARREGAVYERRWKKVHDTFIDLESILLEAETLWGQTIKEHFKPLQQCALTLSTTIQTYLINLEDSSPSDREAERKRRSTMYAFTDGSSVDPFTNKITKAVNEMENFLNPRLKI